MSADADRGARPELLRPVVPAVVGVVVLIAGLSDWDGLGRFGWVLIAAAALLAWCRWPRLPLLVLTAAVCGPVLLAELGGGLEPALFLVSTLAVVIGGWADSRSQLLVCGVLATATPLAIAALQDADVISPAIWAVGIALPGLTGVVLRREGELAAQLAAARRGLIEQAAAEERRQAAREVHDLVGHGLAAMLLQVTSARHVLHRDPASADQALQTAEDTGRQSMRDLRRTVALLRSADDPPEAGPLPGLGDVGGLVDAARAGGLRVELTASSAGTPPPAVGLTVYRIVQESLVNAARHAPASTTTVEVDAAADTVDVTVTSLGAPAGVLRSDGRPGYGVQGMRERAAAAGGALSAGPTPDGWRVHGRIPYEPGAAR